MEGTGSQSDATRLLALVPDPPSAVDRWWLRRCASRWPALAVAAAPAAWPVAAAGPAAEFERGLLRLLDDGRLDEAPLPDSVAQAAVAGLALYAPSAAVGDAPGGPALALRLGAPSSPYGVWSAAVAIARGEPQLLGAHIVARAPGQPPSVVWETAPPLAPGDSGEALTVRSLWAAAAALERLAEQALAGTVAVGRPPVATACRAPERRDWQRYERAARGAASPLTLCRALR